MSGTYVLHASEDACSGRCGTANYWDVCATACLQVALMTGGGSGIGFEITRQLGASSFHKQSSTSRTSSLAAWLPAMCRWRRLQVNQQDACVRSGLHGAAVAITGRRDGVLRDAAAALQREGIRAHAIQVPLQAVTWASAPALPCESLPLVMACFV